MPEQEYQGKPIVKTSLAVRGVEGSALSGVLKVKPQTFESGVPVYVLVEAFPGPITHKPAKVPGSDKDDNDGGWELVNITKATRGTIISADDAVPFLDETAAAIEKARVDATGQEEIPGVSDLEQEALHVEHERGLHKRRRGKCVDCQTPAVEDVIEEKAENVVGIRDGKPAKARGARKGRGSAK